MSWGRFLAMAALMSSVAYTNPGTALKDKSKGLTLTNREIAKRKRSNTAKSKSRKTNRKKR